MVICKQRTQSFSECGRFTIVPQVPSPLLRSVGIGQAGSCGLELSIFLSSEKLSYFFLTYLFERNINREGEGES